MLRTGSYEEVGGGPEFDPHRTGYFKPLPPGQRALGGVARLGLALGQRMAWLIRDDNVYLLIMAGIVGVASGVAAGVLLVWLDRANALIPRADEWGAAAWAAVILIPAVGGGLVGVLRRALARRSVNDADAPAEMVDSIPRVVAAIGENSGHLRGREGAGLAVGTGLTIASGGSAGHEAATVVVGATVGSVVARFFGLRLRRQIIMVGAGCASGLAAAFNAPLAGVIFTAEVVFGRSVGASVGRMSVFTPLIVAAVAGTYTSHAIFGQRPEFTPGATTSLVLGDVPFFFMLAVSAGLVSPLLSRAILSTQKGFERAIATAWLRPAVGGLGVGLLGSLGLMVRPELFEVLGTGRAVIESAIGGELLWWIALPLLALKILATALTIGSGGMGGVFMPSLFIGACLGGLVFTGADATIGASSHVSAYVMVGMGAMFAASLRAPLTPIVMIFELTHDYALMVPLMFGCIIASFVARRVQHESLFEAQMREFGYDAAAATEEGEVMRRGQVGQLMVRPDHMLRETSSLDEVRRACSVEGVRTLYVVDDTGRVTGFIDATNVAARALAGDLSPDTVVRDLLMRGRPIMLFPEDTLAGAMLAFTRSGCSMLPVVDRDHLLLGLLERDDLIAHYAEHVLQRRDEGVQILGGARGPDQELGLGRGITLERVVIGRRWAGRTLESLNLRQAAGVQLLEWRRDDELLTIDPKRPLREGDVVALAGNREALLEARWL
jgi:CIC family chloride channel protein